jgi:hypothetical protein
MGSKGSLHLGVKIKKKGTKECGQIFKIIF